MTTPTDTSAQRYLLLSIGAVGATGFVFNNFGGSFSIVGNWMMWTAALVVAVTTLYGWTNDKTPPTGAIWVSRVVKGLVFTIAIMILLVGPNLTLSTVEKIRSEATEGVVLLIDAEAREGARIKQKTQERAARVEEARIAAEIAAEAEIANQAAAEEAEANRTQNNGLPCAGRWEDERECDSITFGANEKYDRTVTVGFHLVADDPSKVTVTSLGGNDHRIIPIRPNITVRIWEEAS